MAQKTGLSQLNICWPTVNIQRGGGGQASKNNPVAQQLRNPAQWSPVQWCNGGSKSIDEILPHPRWIIEICSRVAAVACIFCLFFLTRKNSFKPQWWFQIYIYTSKLWTGNSGEKKPLCWNFYYCNGCSNKWNVSTCERTNRPSISFPDHCVIWRRYTATISMILPHECERSSHVTFQ